MAAIITTAGDAVNFINTLYESDETAPVSGDSDFSVWLSLMNIAINMWEYEEGILWKELFVSLADAADGDKTTSAADTSYACPTNFRFPASGYVWLGSGTSKTAYKVVPIEKVQLMENDSSNWCYFVTGSSSTLEFNPNLSSTMPAGYTISYNYYKSANALTASASTFDMSDPMFAVYYALSELKRDEDDTVAGAIASQKLEGMKTRNILPSWYQDDGDFSFSDAGLGI